MVAVEEPGEDVESILVPIDGSEAASAALETALSIAAACEASVHVLAVVDVGTQPFRFDVEFVGDLEEARTRLVERVHAEYGDRTVPVTGSVRRTTPVRGILREASEREVDLIVMGRSGTAGLAAPLLGSTTGRVLRRAEVPVLVVPAEGDDPLPADETAQSDGAVDDPGSDGSH